MITGGAADSEAKKSLAPSAVNGKVPRTGMLIAVEEVFFHCGKALKRARLWDPATHIDRAAFPSLGRIMADQVGGATVEQSEQRIEQGYRERMY